MKTIDLVYFDAGGGHRSSALALQEAIRRQGYPWEARLFNLQEALEPIDVVKKITGLRLQDGYNAMLRRSWTLGLKHLIPPLQALIRLYHGKQVELLGQYWRSNRPDLVVSMVPHFNRALREGLERGNPGTPFVTVLTDLADYPPHFWLERQEQFVVCGSEKAVAQAESIGLRSEQIIRTSGMIVHPRFYEPVVADRSVERRRLGLDPDMTTGMVMFGGQGSRAMLEIARRLSESSLELQLILMCGRNQRLAGDLRRLKTRFGKFVEEFTTDVPYYMHLSDFFIGKPGPGSISEALLMKLPVIVESNAWTVPQERYNAEWIRERDVGLVFDTPRNIVPAVSAILQSGTLARLQANAAALNNRAIYELPAVLDRLLNYSSLLSEQALGA
jgi:1,2-diacylglycerol 3-beta-galactosyltransferase